MTNAYEEEALYLKQKHEHKGLFIVKYKITWKDHSQQRSLEFTADRNKILEFERPF